MFFFPVNFKDKVDFCSRKNPDQILSELKAERANDIVSCFLLNALPLHQVPDELDTWLVAQLLVPVEVAEVVGPRCCARRFLCGDTLLQTCHWTEEEIFSGKGNAKLFPALWGALRPLTMASACETVGGPRYNSPSEDVEKNGWERRTEEGGWKNNIAGKHNGERAVVWVCRSPRQWEARCGCCIRCGTAGSRCLGGRTQWGTCVEAEPEKEQPVNS